MSLKRKIEAQRDTLLTTALEEATTYRECLDLLRFVPRNSPIALEILEHAYLVAPQEEPDRALDRYLDIYRKLFDPETKECWFPDLRDKICNLIHPIMLFSIDSIGVADISLLGSVINEIPSELPDVIQTAEDKLCQLLTGAGY